MKKRYIIPTIETETIEVGSDFIMFSRVMVKTIGEGDNVTNAGQLGNGQATSETGEGLNAKRGWGTDAWTWSDFEDDEY